MAVAGQQIVAVCKENTVNVYDAVTGVLRLSLHPPQPVTKAEGSPDGSVLFLVYQQAHQITVWHTQTGGLIYTLTTLSDINNVAVSSKGKYLGSCSSDGTFEFWGVERRYGGSHSLNQAVTYICWLEPEDQVALALEQSIVILEVTTGKTLHTFSLGGSLQRITFSAYQYQLAFSLVQEAESKIGTINIQTGTVLESPYTLHDVSCLTFSGDGSQVICVTNVGNLLSYEPRRLSRWNHHLSHLGAIHSMSVLQGGHLVMSSRESIQLLGSECTQLSGASPDPGITHVHQLSSDEAVSGSSKDHGTVNLLDMLTMKILINHHIKFDELDASFKPHFLCTSIDRGIAVLHLQKHNGFTLELHRIGQTHPTWEQHSSQPVLLGTLSPNGQHLVTISGSEDLSGGGDWKFCVWGLMSSSGSVLNPTSFIQKGRPPSKIMFTSENQFCTEDHHIQMTSTLETQPTPRTTVSMQSGDCHISPDIQKSITQRPDEMTTSATILEGQPHTRVYHKEHCVQKTFSLETVGSYLEIKEVSRKEIVITNPYRLDDNLEWVVDTESRRVCWLPPGYVTEAKDGHFFVGSSIVTAGQDGIVRKLTFREPRSYL